MSAFIEPYSIAATRIDPGSAMPLYRQIYDALRQDILSGRLGEGRRLTATREMATQLGVSRNTVVEAIDQLIAEGFLQGRVGAGTYVTNDLCRDFLHGDRSISGVEAERSPPISHRGRKLMPWASRVGNGRRFPFQIGRPALDEFPWKIWRRLTSRIGRELDVDWLDYSEAAGYPPLREALARYLYSARGLQCSPEQIIVVRGSQQGMDLAARVLLDPGDHAWIEDPGYPGARAALEAAGIIEVPVPVDHEGLVVDAGEALCREARLAYVTPSHQFPLGVTLSLSRRLQLLSWARQNDAWILEDDYDSEFRFAGRPLASLAGLDGGSHVVYLGTLSKVLFPALRLGYLVVPTETVDAFVAARYAADRNTGILEQAVVAEFFEEGHFNRHVRRMRRLCDLRQQILRHEFSCHLDGHIELQFSQTGLHSVGWLQSHADDAEVASRAAQVGVRANALSAYCTRRKMAPGLLLGYAGFPEQEIKMATKRLATVFA